MITCKYYAVRMYQNSSYIHFFKYSLQIGWCYTQTIDTNNHYKLREKLKTREKKRENIKNI